MAEEPSDDDREDDADRNDSFTDDTDPSDAPSVENPFQTDDPAADVPAGDSAAGGERDGDAPLDRLAREVGRRRRRADDDPDPGEDPFEEVDVGDLDGENLWASLSGEGSGTETGAAGAPSADASTGSSAVAEPNTVSVDADAADARSEHVLDKREYCQRCPYLTAPPEVACEHEDTDILEVVDAERFRVRGCPMVTDEGRPTFSAGREAGDGTERDGASTARGRRGDSRADEGDDGPVADGFDA